MGTFTQYSAEVTASNKAIKEYFDRFLDDPASAQLTLYGLALTVCPMIKDEETNVISLAGGSSDTVLLPRPFEIDYWLDDPSQEFLFNPTKQRLLIRAGHMTICSTLEIEGHPNFNRRFSESGVEVKSLGINLSRPANNPSNPFTGQAVLMNSK